MLGHVGNICARRLWIATLLGSPLHHWVAGEVERLESPNGDSHHPGRAASGMLHALTRAWHPHWELFWNDFEALTTMTQLLDAAFDSSTILQLSGGHQWTRVFWFGPSNGCFEHVRVYSQHFMRWVQRISVEWPAACMWLGSEDVYFASAVSPSLRLFKFWSFSVVRSVILNI